MPDRDGGAACQQRQALLRRAADARRHGQRRQGRRRQHGRAGSSTAQAGLDLAAASFDNAGEAGSGEGAVTARARRRPRQYGPPLCRDLGGLPARRDLHQHRGRRHRRHRPRDRRPLRPGGGRTPQQFRHGSRRWPATSRSTPAPSPTGAPPSPSPRRRPRRRVPQSFPLPSCDPCDGIRRLDVTDHDDDRRGRRRQRPGADPCRRRHARSTRRHARQRRKRDRRQRRPDDRRRQPHQRGPRPHPRPPSPTRTRWTTTSGRSTVPSVSATAATRRATRPALPARSRRRRPSARCTARSRPAAG